MTELVGILGDLARRGYVGAALTLAKEWGGTRRYIPSHPRPGQELVDLIGVEAARVLAELRGNERVEIPLMAGYGRKKVAVVKAIDGSGGTAREIARAAGCTQRYVKKVRAEIQPDADPIQPNLFD